MICQYLKMNWVHYFQMIKWMLCIPYERTLWRYVIKYQKLLIKQYMLVEPKVIHEDPKDPFNLQVL